MRHSADDDRFMQHALALGRRGLGQTWPNPSVGCIIVKAGRVVGRGTTASGGRPHAEVVALAQADARARGATAYVTLEPCSHHGQSPPCADALIAAGIARVVVAVEDPDPRVSGRGLKALQDAGIDTILGVCDAQARRDHAGFFSRITRGRPHLTLKLALSLDGRIATAGGESQWITGPEARRMVHGLRASSDAVLVGGGTARADNPRLTARGFGALRQPIRIALTKGLDLPHSHYLVSSARAVPTWIAHRNRLSPEIARPFQEAGVTLLPLPVAGGEILLRPALNALADRGLTRILCEGGGALAASLLHADLVDELIVFHAGLALGAEGYPGLSALGIERLSDATRFAHHAKQKVGDDVMTRWIRPPDSAV
ncbi:MAG: bifunctional diaminohydroxyphosphoribosylaminopyrimidine deaminase/5-amino-6-(5-phosphoribosylamino)uracil reductase RibD [Pseudomonadota bacterium]